MGSYGKFGGDGGHPFDDASDARIGEFPDLEIGVIFIHPGDVIDSIQVLYRHRQNGNMVLGNRHGGEGGDNQKPPIVLEGDEYIVEIRGRTGGRVDSLTIQSNKRVYGRYGGSGGDNDYDAPSQQEMQAGNEVYAFFGRSGEKLDAIGIHTRPRRQ